MGEHLGYRVTPRGKGYQGWAWDPASKSYRRQSGFDTAREAREWAKEQHAKFVAKVDHNKKLTTRRLADTYYKHLEDVKKRTPSHLYNVKRALDGLCAACKDILHPHASDQAQDWLSAMTVSAKTRLHYANIVKAMGNWAVKKRMLDFNPLASVEVEEPDEYVKAQFTVDELRKLTNAFNPVEPPGSHGTVDPYRLRFAVMLYAGLRVDEAAHLRWEDVDFSGHIIHIALDTGGRLKNRKERLVPLQSELRALLEPKRPPEGIGAIFPEAQKSLWREFRAFLMRMRVPANRRSPHSTRHCYAGLMTATGTPSILLAAYMGHTSVATTAEYAKLATRYLQAVQGWPRGEFRLLHIEPEAT